MNTWLKTEKSVVLPLDLFKPAVLVANSIDSHVCGV